MDPRHQGKIGWCFIIVFIFCMVVNQIAIISQIIHDWKNSPVVLKRRARFARYYKKVSEHDEEQCSCACASCSGSAKKPIAIDRTPSTFELELIPCDIDNTLLAADEVH